MKTRAFVLAGLAAILLTAGGAVADITIETVPVGNPSNAADSTGYGAVDYEYSIGKYEVTAGQYCAFLNAVDPGGSNPYGLYYSSMDSSSYGCQITWNVGSSTYDFSGRPSGAEADWINRPVNYVSWGDAARFANWLHNGQPHQQLTGNAANDSGVTEDGAYYLNGATSDAALLAVDREHDWQWAITSEDEWYKAAYHRNDGATGNYFDYPTSSDTAPGYVNNSGNLSTTGNPFVEGGTDPGNYATFDGDGGTDGIGSPYYRTVVGEWENSESPYDTFDQGGNVWEWNEAILFGSYRGLRGGSFYSCGVTLHAWCRDYSDPSDGYDNIGFRVSEVPEPGTMALLALGAVGMLRRRRNVRG